MTGDSGTPHSLDRIFDALAHTYRRRILLFMSERSPRHLDGATLEDVATREEAVESSTVELRHVHLPKLADAGYIEWDRDEQTVRPGPNFETVASVVQLVDDHRDDLPGEWP